jgi:tetratricopeptide (TPR) repeat protein
VGDPEFGAAALRALEHGRWRPSPLAWARLVRRLGLGPCPIDVTTLPPPAPDRGALDADVAYHLDHVKAALEAQDAAAAAALLATAAAVAGPHLAHLTPPTRYRWHRLRAGVALRQHAPEAAQTELEQALALARQLGDPQEGVRTRNVLGAVYYTRDQPAQALLHHEACLHALEAGVVKDLTLRLNVVANLANDYLALGDATAALAWYQEARRLLDDLADPARTAGLAWGQSLAHRARGERARALLYATQARTFYTTAGITAEAMRVQVNLAELLHERGDYADAAALLAEARAYQTAAGNDLFLSSAYEQSARLELARGDLAQAAEYAAAALGCVAPLVEAFPPTVPAAPAVHVRRTAARAFRTAGLVAERQATPAQTDRYFQQALALLAAMEGEETRTEVAAAYAEVWLARGDPAQAGVYYRLALHAGSRPTAARRR